MLATDITTLEELLAAEIRCQARTAHVESTPDFVPCSGAVTHRIQGCSPGGLVCRNTADRAVRIMGRGGLCGGCFTPASECWSVCPV